MSAIVLASTVNIPHEVWLDWRKKGIGGSDASAVCGVNIYKSPVALFMEKTGQPTQDEAGESAYWGKQLEYKVSTTLDLYSTVYNTVYEQTAQTLNGAFVRLTKKNPPNHAMV